MKIIFGILVFFFAIGPAHADGGGKIKVVATLFPQFDFARQIGKDKVEVSLLLPPGVEAHEYEPKPHDILAIDNADIFIYTGKSMEPWAAGILDGIHNKSLIVVDAGMGVRLRKSAVGIDPHIWLDLGNAGIMADNIAAALAEKDPGNRDFYLNNAVEYKVRLGRLDAAFREAFADCKYRIFISAGHFTFGYFADRYNLTHLSPYKGYSPDAEPTPRDMIESVKKVKEHGLKFIYYEELLSPKLAEAISSETGAAILELNGAHNITKQNMDRGATFISIMEGNLENLKKGLECR